MVFTESVSISTKGFCDVIDVTGEVADVIARSGLKRGIVTVFCKGSTCAVSTIEFESGVIRDLQKAIEAIAPSNIPYEHDRRWGDGNGFSHVRAALMKPSLTVPFMDGEMALGAWQQIVFLDFDNRRRDRDLVVQVMGE